MLICFNIGINYYEEDDWMGKLPEGMLSISIGSSVHSNRSETHQPRVTDDSLWQQDDYRQEFTDITMREKITNKWNSLKMFCWRRRESMQPETAAKNFSRRHHHHHHRHQEMEKSRKEEEQEQEVQEQGNCAQKVLLETT